MGYSITQHMSTAGKKVVCFFLIVLFAACPIMGSDEAHAFTEFTIKDELELGKKFNVLVRSRMPIIQDPEVSNYVKGIVDKLSASMPPQPFPFTTSVIRHNAVNAFATPGGYIFIHTGLILAMEHEAEVAGVIAHEMAHVSQRHIASRIAQSRLTGLLSLVGALAGAFLGGEGGQALMSGSIAAGQASMLNYSRNDENEADQVGMNYLVKAGFAPQGMVGAFQKIGKKQWIMGTQIPTYLSTHPDVNERASDMQVRVDKLSANQKSTPYQDKAFLRIQTLVRAKYSDAKTAYQYFINQRKGPNKDYAQLGLAILASRQNKVKEAARLFADVLKAIPNDILAVREAGIFHYTKGNKAEGTQLLQQAIQIDKNDIFSQFYYAKNLADAGNTSQAILHLQKVLSAVPEDTEVHEFMARLYGQEGQMFKANMHMAYGALYINNSKRVDQFFKKAKSLARTDDERNAVKRFDTEYNERKQFWK